MNAEELDERSRDRARTGRMRVTVLGIFVVALLMAMAGLLQHQQHELASFVHQQCLSRQVNAARSNQIWADLAAIEPDPARKAIYQNAHFAVPVCD